MVTVPLLRNPGHHCVWTECEPAKGGGVGLRDVPSQVQTPPGELHVRRFSADVRVLIYAFYSSWRRCYPSLRTEIKICILQVQIFCTYSFTVSLQGGSINLVTGRFLRKLIPSSWGYSQLVFGGGVIGILECLLKERKHWPFYLNNNNLLCFAH